MPLYLMLQVQKNTPCLDAFRQGCTVHRQTRLPCFKPAHIAGEQKSALLDPDT